MRVLLWSVRLLILLVLVVDLRLYRYGLAGDVLVETPGGLEYPTLSLAERVAWIGGLLVVHGILFWSEWRLRRHLRMKRSSG